MTTTRILTAAVLAALALTACGSSEAPTSTNEPVTVAPVAPATPAAPATPTTPVTPGTPAAPGTPVAGQDLLAAVRDLDPAVVASTGAFAEEVAATAMSNCGDPAATLAGLEDLLDADAYREAQANPGGVVLELQADLPTDCVKATDVAVSLNVEGPYVVAQADVTQRMTALRDGAPAPLTVQRGYTLRLQPTADGTWLVIAATTTDPNITAG